MPARGTSYWTLPARQSLFLAAFAATVVVVVGLRLYRLDTLQAEIFGDITIVREYLNWIRDRLWPTHFVMSAGPIYAYLITPLIALTGPSYFGIKLASVVVSLATLAVTYLLVRRLADDRIALVALFITGVSSWLLIFSRLGNVQVLSPLLIVVPLYFLVRHVQGGGIANLIGCAATASLGLYCMPQTFVHAPVVFAVLLAVRWSQRRIRIRELVIFVAVAALFALPMAAIVAQDPGNFFSGYIGGKLAADKPFLILSGNIERALRAFHWRGDGINRSNPPLLPHLDPVSGALMLLGFVFWLRRPYRQWAPVILMPLLLLLVPSVLVLRTPQEVPSASRTLATVPFACILAAGGLWLPAEFLARKLRPWVGAALVVPVLLVILALNIDRYFVRYLAELPYHNTPIARLIREYIDHLPPGTEAHLVGCCWESSMPEPKGIEYELPPHRKLVYWPYPDRVRCEVIARITRPAVLIWSFREALPSAAAADCPDLAPSQVYASAEGYPVFSAAPLLVTAASLVSAVPAPTPSPYNVGTNDVFTIVSGPRATATATVDGEVLQITHSLLDGGAIENLFDGNPESLIRGEADNPFFLELRFPEPRPKLASVSLHFASMQTFAVKITAERSDAEPATLEKGFVGLPGEPVLEFEVPGDRARPVNAVRFEIVDRRATPGEGYHLHLRGLSLKGNSGTPVPAGAGP